MTFSGGKRQFGLRKAVHSLASLWMLPRHAAALMGDWAWVAVEEVFACHPFPQMMQKKKVCQTGRHWLHSGVVERRSMKVKPWKGRGHLREGWSTSHGGKELGWGYCERERMRSRCKAVRGQCPWNCHLLTSAPERSQSLRNCHVYR